MKKDNGYISDQLESQPWSRDMGQVQVIEAGEGKKKRHPRSMKTKVLRKMK